jgi:autotransporter-associated beta strand protein
MILPTQAAWTGAGSPGGDPGATNFNDTVNWTGGVIDGNLCTIGSHVTLRLTADYNATNGINLVEPVSTLVRHITLCGTNTLTLSGAVPGYTNTQPRQVMLPSNAQSTVTLAKGLTVNLSGNCNFRGIGALFIDAKMAGAGNFLSASYSGTPYIILRNDANNFTGSVSGDGGYLHFTSVANKGVPSAFGAGTSDIGVNNYAIVYIGARDSFSNRGLSLLNSNCYLRNDSACGGLCFTGTVYIGQWVYTDVYLDSISTGESQLSGNMSDYGYDTATSKNLYTKLDKRHSGTWRLTGKNTFTGWPSSPYHITLAGGTLIADYANDVAGAGSNRVFAAGRNVSFSDAKLVIRGKTGAGNTTWQSFGTNTVSDSTLNVLAIDGNGGNGTTVALDTLAMSGSIALLRVERIGNATLAVTNAFAADSGTVRPFNGVLMANSGACANILVKDPDGRVGFASQNAALEIVRNTNTYELEAATGTTLDHVTLSNSLTRTAHLAAATLTIDATANDVTLDMAGYTFQTNGNAVGRGVAVYGGHAVSIQGGAQGAQWMTLIHNYTTNKLTWALSNGTCIYVSAGPGLTEFTRPLSNTLYITEGTTRLTAAQTFTNGVISLFGNGVLEIGADLNGTAAGDFTRGTGTSAGQILFGSGGGFSAYGTDRTVNIGGSSGTFYWQQDGKPLIFSSPSANATLIFQNPIAFSTRTREIRVQNGSASVDARLTGKISGTIAAGFNKTGAGSLELTGQQDYRGDCSVIGGGLRLGADNVFAGGTNALVLSGATLDAGTYRNTFNTLELLTNSVIEVGDGSAALAFADSSAKTWTGTLAVNGKLAATTLRFGTDNKGLTAAQIASISKDGGSLYLDAQGYLRQTPRGSVLFLD